MKMKEVFTMRCYFTLLAFLSFSGSSLYSEGSLIPAAIPNNLLECYNSSDILTKDNLLPMTVNVLVALIRKLEDQLTNMDMRTLAPAILSRFRFDGIERNPNVDPHPYVIPYGLTGPEFNLFQTIFQQVLPNIGSSIPNETLTYLERCTLHRMLSSSIDVWDRGDGDSSCPSGNQQVQSWNFRFPREIAKFHDAEVFDPHGMADRRIMSGSFANEDYQQNDYNYPESRCPLENGVVNDKYGSISPGVVLAGLSAGLNPQLSPPTNLFKGQPRGGLRRKPGVQQGGGYQPSYYPGYQPQAPNAHLYQSRGRVSQYDPAPQPQPKSGRYPYNGNGPAGVVPNYGPNYGAVAIDSKYAATLAGSLAYVALLLGPESSRGLRIGSAGRWNNTMVPKYYFLTDYYSKYALTDARISGGLDGMQLADNIQKWLSMGGNIKLSQILSMYYSKKGVLGSQIKACNRKGNSGKYTSGLSDQAYSMAEVLKDDLPQSVTVQDEAIHEYTESSTQLLTNYIPSLPGLSCANDYYSNDTKVPVDLTIVLDCNWNFRDISNILQVIADNCDLRKYGANLTLINGKDGSVMIESMQTPLDLGNYFNRTAYTTKWSIGFDFTKVLSLLKQRFKDKLDYDRIQNSAGGYPRVVLFIPYQSTTINDGDTYSAKLTLQYFKESIPDVKFLYLVSGPNRFGPFAEDPDKDIITFSIGLPFDKLFTRLSTVQRRVINPSCGRNWSGYWYNQVSINGYLDSGEIHFYKISTNYFFRDVNAVITITADSTADTTLTVCKSRVNSLPISNLSRSGDIDCHQLTASKSYSFSITSDVCSSNYYAYQCNPYYFSVTNGQRMTPSIICRDQECRDPDMTKYTISHQGLSCYNSVAKILVSPTILVIMFVHLFKF